MILERVEKFVSRFTKYFIKNKDGFYEFPYLANSPEVIIQNLLKVPFTRHSKNDQLIYCNTPFAKSEIYYQELENGLWIIYAEAEYKTSILLNRVLDEHLLANYYIFGLEISTTKTKFKKSLDHEFSYSNYNCQIYKPESNAMHCMFKGTKVSTINIFFDKTWLKEVLVKESFFINSNISRFLEGDTAQLSWPVCKSQMDSVYFPIVRNIKNKKKGTDPEVLRKQLSVALEWFVRQCDQGKSRAIFFDLPDQDKKAILATEKFLTKNLNAPFLGIKALSKYSGMSPTKLKNDFKIVFGETIFQYFRQKQMEFAFHLIRYEGKSIQNVCQQMGYENGSKFALAFKKHLGTLPSNIR